MSTFVLGAVGGGGGVQLVRELPKARKGRIVYVVETYTPGDTYTATDFDIIVTAANLPNDIQRGYSSGAVAALGIGGAGGAIDPAIADIEIIAFNISNGLLFVRFSAALTGQFLQGGHGPMEVVVGGQTYTLARDGGSNWWRTPSDGAIPAGSRWGANQNVTLRLLRAGTRSGVTKDGIRTVGDKGRPTNEDEVPEGFYHVDPVTGEWVEGLGGGIGGGIPGVLLPEAGLSDADMRDHKWRGLLVGLAREGAGADWRLLTVAGTDPVQARAEIPNAAATATLTIRFDIGAAGGIVDGEDGNDADVSVVSSGANTVRVDTAGPTRDKVATVRVWVNNQTFDQVAALANAQAGLRATVTGDGSLPFPTPGSGQELYDFIGGVNGADLGTSLDVAQKFVELVHHTGHDQEELAGYLNGLKLDGDTTLYAIVLPGSDPSLGIDNAPLNRPFTEYFSPGSLPRPSTDEIDDRIKALVKPYAVDGGPLIAGPDADPAFVLEPEVTQAFLLGIIGLTAQQLNDLFVGAAVTGTGAGRVITVTQVDGSTITLAVPDTGGGGGGGTADGVVTSAVFSADGMTLTLGTSTGGTVTGNIPALLRQAGLSQQTVQSLVEAYLQNYDTATEVAASIAQSLTNYRRLATVVENTGNVTLTAGDRGSTMRHTGNAATTYSPATADPPVGWWTRLLNTSSAVLTFDVGVTRRIEGAGQSVEIAAGDCVTVQFLGAATWAVITDTAGAAAASGGGEAARELVVLAAPEPILATSGATSQAFPADYATYHNFEVVATTTGNVLTIVRGRTSWLAGQTDAASTKFGVLDQSEAGTRQWLTWTPTTRTWGRGGQNPGTELSVRIVSARLYDDGGGGAGEIEDNSLEPIKTKATTPAEQAAWRARFMSAHISVTDALPAIADANIGSDVVILRAGIADGISIVDITDPNTPVTSAEVGDVLMALMFREAVWTRVGNIITGRGDATARAAVAALMLRVDANEQLTSDIDRIVDSVSWANAPAAEAQFAAVLATSALGRKITRVDQTAIDPAADIPAATQWNTILNPVPDDSAILIRVATGLAPIQFRMNNNGSVEPLFSFRGRVSDANWDYYQGGVVSGGASAIEKRTEAFHTAWHGDLAGRALAPINALQSRATALEGQAWPGAAFVTPHELHPGIGAFTMRVALRRAAGTFPNGSRMRIAVGVRNGAFVHATEDLNSPATLAFDAAQSRALIQNTANGWIGGTLYLDVYQSDEATRITRIPLYVPVVQGSVGPLITNIASYDATQDRFEDSGGGPVALPAGSIVLTTQAIYDAAAADSFAFPANVIFFTR